MSELASVPEAKLRIKERRLANEGLGPHTTGADGALTWEWAIGPGTTPGEGSVSIDCAGAEASAPITITS